MIELRAQKDSMGRFLTHAMFFELSQTADIPATFTLKEHDHEYEGVKYLSLRQIYLEMEDPTEYLFAIEVFGSWDHWTKLCNSSLIRQHIDKWRDELEIKLRAKAINAMVDTAIHGGTKGTTAAKWVASGGWNAGKGRPTKAEKERQAKIANQLDDETSEHVELLRKFQNKN